MPNWCNNNITITGPNKIIDKIEKIVKNEKYEKPEDGLLHYFHPLNSLPNHFLRDLFFLPQGVPQTRRNNQFVRH